MQRRANEDEQLALTAASWGVVKLAPCAAMPTAAALVHAAVFAMVQPDARLSAALASTLNALPWDVMVEFDRLLAHPRARRLVGFLLESTGHEYAAQFALTDLMLDGEPVLLTALRRPHWLRLWEADSTPVHHRWGVLGKLDPQEVWTSEKLPA